MGLGKRMFSRLEEFFKKNIVDGIYLTADPITGKPFWKALGFSATGKISDENGQELFEKYYD